jgi:hypothetical protein
MRSLTVGGSRREAERLAARIDHAVREHGHWEPGRLREESSTIFTDSLDKYHEGDTI